MLINNFDNNGNLNDDKSKSSAAFTMIFAGVVG